MAYIQPNSDQANLTFSEVYTPPNSIQANLIIGYVTETRIQSRLYQVWTDENYVYCATANGLGIIPIGG